MHLQRDHAPLASQRLKQVFKHYSLSFWSGLLISAVPVLALWTEVAHPVLLGWMLALWIELAGRYVFARRSSRPGDGADESKWLAGLVAIAAIDGAFWGLSVWIFAVPPTSPATMFVLLVIATVAVFDSKELAAVPGAATACLLTTLSPIALWLFSFGTPLTNLMGSATLGYLALMLIFSRHSYHAICKLQSSDKRSGELAQTQRENEQRMARYFESAPGYFFTLEHRIDGSDAITFASPGIRELFGLEPETVMRDFSAFVAIIHPEDIGMVFGKASDSMRNLMPLNIEYRINHPQKAVRWCEVHALPQRMADGGTRWDGFMYDITGRKQTEANHIQLQRQLQIIADNLPGAVTCNRMFPDGTGKVLYASKGLWDVFGFTQQELADDITPMAWRIHPEDLPQAAEKMIAAARTLSTYTGEFRVNHPGKGEIWVQQISTPVYESEGSMLWYGLMFDVTERKRMEESLNEREYEYRTLAENFPDVVIRYDRDYRRIYVNPAFVELAGMDAGELGGKGPLDASPLLDVETYMRGLRSAVERGISSSMELPVRRVNGDEGWYIGSFVPEFDVRGNVSGVLMVARDITERKRMEAALQQSEAQYRHQNNLLHAILESPSKIGMYALDREYRYLAFNGVVREGFKRLWGTDLAVGMSMLDDAIKNDEAHRAFCKRGFDHVLAGNNFYIESKEAMVIEGETVYEYHDNYSSPIYDDKGEVIGLTVFVTDTTERKQAEHKLEEYRAQLRGLLAQRESAREEERKLIARDVHDDLGQILTGLKMNLSVMERKCAEEAPSLRELIQQSRALMDSAIGTVRNISSALRPVELDMGIAAAIGWHAGQFATYTGISCEVRLDEAETRLDENDAVALFRIVQESLTNIAKHARASRVNISLAREADDYMLQVCDNGIGFDVNLKKEGSFGLIGIKERVLLLGGELAINSEAGEGTRIIVRFPASVKNFRESL